jgi:hypothetical protein
MTIRALLDVPALRCVDAVEDRPEIPVRLPAADLVLDALAVVCLVDPAPVRKHLVAQHKWCVVENHHIDRATKPCLKVSHSFQAIEGTGSKVIVSVQQER